MNEPIPIFKCKQFELARTHVGIELLVKESVPFPEVVDVLMRAHDEASPFNSLRTTQEHVEAVIIGPKNYFKGYVRHNGDIRSVSAYSGGWDGLVHEYVEPEQGNCDPGKKYTLVRVAHLEEDDLRKK
jgi:hypothetical protein